jgi:hypothetical protein
VAPWLTLFRTPTSPAKPLPVHIFYYIFAIDTVYDIIFEYIVGDIDLLSFGCSDCAGSRAPKAGKIAPDRRLAVRAQPPIAGSPVAPTAKRG